MKIAFTVAMQVFVFERLQCEAVWKAGWAVGLQTEEDTQRGGLKKSNWTKQSAFHWLKTLETAYLYVFVNMQPMNGSGGTLRWHNTWEIAIK